MNYLTKINRRQLNEKLRLIVSLSKQRFPFFVGGRRVDIAGGYLIGLTIVLIFLFVSVLSALFSRRVHYFPDEIEETADFIELFNDVELLPLSSYKYSHILENTCKFPVIDKEEVDLLKYTSHARRIECEPKVFETYVKQFDEDGSIFVSRPAGSARIGSFECFFRELNGTIAPHKRMITYKGPYYRLAKNKRMIINKDQFVIKCFDERNETLYRDVFAYITPKVRLNPPKVEKPDELSIAILVLDSVSKTQFLRHMPYTMKFMREHDFQILNAYNKVGDNSAPNLLPILSGKVMSPKHYDLENMVRDDMHLLDEQIEDDVWKHADLLIKKAKDRGCATMWADDIMHPKLGLFHYDKFEGFKYPPTDYYFRPFYEYLYKHFKARKLCVNGELVTPRFINLYEKFSSRYAQHCHFSFNFITSITHDDSSNLELHDTPLSNALKRMKENGVLNNTVLLILGDHGQRIHEIQTTHSGRIEERSPFMSIYIPEKYRNKYPDKYRNLQINTNRLTSNFDVHETLRELMGLPAYDHRKPVGISLFNRISRQRNCTNAKVPEHFCMCMQPVDMPELIVNIKMESHALMQVHVGSILDSMACLNTYRLEDSFNYTLYTISTMARRGGRFMADWIELLESGQNFTAAENDIFEMEFETPISFQWSDEWIANGQTNGEVKIKSRVILNKSSPQIRMLTRPLVMQETSTLRCDVKIMDRLCECAPKINKSLANEISRPKRTVIFDNSEADNTIVEL